MRHAGVSEPWLQCLAHGFDLGLVAPVAIPRAAPPDNYSSLDDYSSLVEGKLDELFRSGVLEEVPEDAPPGSVLYHPIGAVPKGMDDCRIVVDTSATGLNAANDREHRDEAAPLPRCSDALKEGYFLCTFDLSAGFHHGALKVQPGLASLLGIRTPRGRRGRFRFICFGPMIAPFLFQGTMMEAHGATAGRH